MSHFVITPDANAVSDGHASHSRMPAQSVVKVKPMGKGEARAAREARRLKPFRSTSKSRFSGLRFSTQLRPSVTKVSTMGYHTVLQILRSQKGGVKRLATKSNYETRPVAPRESLSPTTPFNNPPRYRPLSAREKKIAASILPTRTDPRWARARPGGEDDQGPCLGDIDTTDCTDVIPCDLPDGGEGAGGAGVGADSLAGGQGAGGGVEGCWNADEQSAPDVERGGLFCNNKGGRAVPSLLDLDSGDDDDSKGGNNTHAASNRTTNEPPAPISVGMDVWEPIHPI
jgi:hypothetical protein